MSAIEHEKVIGEAIGLHPTGSLRPRRGLATPSLGPTMRRRAAGAALLVGDAASYLLVHLALLGLGLPQADGALSQRFAFLVAALCLLQFAAASLYPGYELHPYEQMRRRMVISITTTASAAGFAALLLPDWRPVAGALPILVIAPALQPLLRSVLRRQLRRLGLWGTEVAVLGDPDLAPQVAAYFRDQGGLGFLPVLPSQIGSSRTRPPVALLAVRGMPPREELAGLLRRFEQVIVLADLPSLKVSGLQPGNLGGRVGLVLRSRAEGSGRRLARRLTDLVVASLAVVALAPIMTAAALAIWLVDPGPVIYRQAREGAQGRTLHLLKLRTMYQDAEKRLEALISSDPALRVEWETHFKLKDDPRILPVVGRFLRSTSCDELPQFFNVIAGQMSLVGPRPFPEYHLAAWDEAFRAKRRSVMPGLTGLWQVSSRSTADLRLQQQLDEYYIDNRSLWLDGDIVLRTFRAVLGRNGAY